MGGAFSFCYNSNTQDPARTPLKSQKFQEELSRLNNAHAEAKGKMGGSAQAIEYAQALLGVPGGAFALGLANKRQHVQSVQLILEHALASEAPRGVRGNERVVEIFFWKGEVLWWAGDRRAAVKELREGLRLNIVPRLLDSLCEKLVQVGQADDGMPKVIKVVAPKAQSDDERRLLIEAFYKHTKLGYRAMYAWLPEKLVDDWVEEHGDQYRQGGDAADKDTSFLERKMTLKTLSSKESLLSRPPELLIPGEEPSQGEEGGDPGEEVGGKEEEGEKSGQDEDEI